MTRPPCPPDSLAASPKPLVSVATVCFNAMATLPQAAASLFSQTFQAYEWVVVDGGSTDGSPQWLQQHRGRVATLVSEPDRGIFDAMNKAAGLAKGEWLYFLNADDRLADPQVLAGIAETLRKAEPQVGIIYGDARYTDGHKEWPRAFNWVTARNLVYGDLCHQVVFVRRDLFKTLGGFDLALRFNADFDWLLRAIRSGVQMQYIHRDIACFYKGGAHVQAAAACETERFVVRYRYRQPWQWRLGNLMLRAGLKWRRMRGEPV